MQNLKDKVEKLLIDEGVLQKFKSDEYNFDITYNSFTNVFNVSVDYNNDLDIDNI